MKVINLLKLLNGVFLFCLIIFSVNAVDLNSCQEITSSGDYFLTNDVVTGSGDCFNIRANNVLLDCQNNFINFSSGAGVNIEYQTGDGTYLSNVNVTNCNFYSADNEYAIYGAKGHNYLFYNNTFYSSLIFGTYAISDSVFDNFRVINSDYSAERIIRLYYHSNDNVISNGNIFVTANNTDVIHFERDCFDNILENLSIDVRGDYTSGLYFKNNIGNMLLRNVSISTSELNSPGLFFETGWFNITLEKSILDTTLADDFGIGDIDANTLLNLDLDSTVDFTEIPQDPNLEVFVGGQIFNIIDSCQDLNSPGTYILNSDGNFTGTCFNVLSDDVNLNCNGNNLIYEDNGYGINASGINNFNLNNCNFVGTVDSGADLYLSSSLNNKFNNNKFTSLSVKLFNVSGSNFTNNNFEGNISLTFLGDVEGNLFEGNYFNSSYGFLFTGINQQNSFVNNDFSVDNLFPVLGDGFFGNNYLDSSNVNFGEQIFYLDNRGSEMFNFGNNVSNIYIENSNALEISADLDLGNIIILNSTDISFVDSLIDVSKDVFALEQYNSTSYFYNSTISTVSSNVIHTDSNISLFNTSFDYDSVNVTDSGNIFVFHYLNSDFAHTTGLDVNGQSVLMESNRFSLTKDISAGSISYPLLTYKINSSGINPTNRINTYTAQVFPQSSDYYLDVEFNFSENLNKSFLIQKSQATVNYNITNTTIETYSAIDGYAFQKTISFTVNSSDVISLVVGSPIQITVGTTFINSSELISSCNDMSYDTRCDFIFNISLNPGLSAPTQSDFKIPVSYTNYDGSITEFNISYNIELTEYIDLLFSPTVLIFNQPSIENGAAIQVEIANSGSSGSGIVSFDLVEDDFEMYYDDSLVSLLPSISAGSSIFVDLRFVPSMLTEHYSEGNITAYFGVNEKKYPYLINITQNLNLTEINYTIEHNTSIINLINLSNDGNILLENIDVSYIEGTLNSSFIEFDSHLSDVIYSDDSELFSLNLSIPFGTEPGEYNGTLNFSGEYGYEQLVPIKIVVPVNRSWVVSPLVMDSELVYISTGGVTYLTPFNITNLGNVNLSFSTTPVYSNLAENDFPQTKYENYGDPVEDFNLSVGERLSVPVGVQYFSNNEVTPSYQNMGLGINFSVLNITNTNQETFLALYVINVTDANPTVTEWRNLDNSILGIDFLEINKPFEFYVKATDDGDKLNTSSAKILVESEGFSVNITPYSVDSSTNIHKYYFNYTPTLLTDYNFTFEVKETEEGGSKAGNSTKFFSIITKPTNVNLGYYGSGEYSFDGVNQTDDYLASIRSSLFMTGDVSIYDVNLTLYDYNNYGWSLYTTSLDTYDLNGDSRNYDLNISIPAGTAIGTYYFKANLTYKNPDNSIVSEIQSDIFEISVLDNNDFIILVNDTINVSHDNYNYFNFTIDTKGNSLTNFSIGSDDGRYDLKFKSGESYLDEINAVVDFDEDYVVECRLEVPENEYLNGSTELYISNEDKLVNKNLTFNVIDSLEMTLGDYDIGLNKVAGKRYNETLIEIENSGNVNLSLDFSLTGNISSLESYGGIGADLSVLSIVLVPGDSFPLNWIYSLPNTQNTYGGNLLITGDVTRVVPISLNSLQADSIIGNLSTDSGLVYGNLVSFFVNVTFENSLINDNISFKPYINGVPCTGVNYVLTDLYAVSCNIPDLTDASDYSLTLVSEYSHPTLGLINVDSSNVLNLSYKDVTAPEIVNVLVPDLELGATTFVEVNISDNVVINYDNRNDYSVTLNFDESSFELSNSIGHFYEFNGEISLDTVGDEEYSIVVTDAEGNFYTYTDSLTVYEEKNYTHNVNYTNDDDLIVGANLTVNLSNSKDSYEFNVNEGILESFSSGSSIKTGIYNLTVADDFLRFIVPDYDLNEVNDILFNYGKIKSDDYRTIVKNMYSDAEYDHMYDGFYFNASGSNSGYFDLEYDVSSLDLLNNNDLKAIVCQDYDLITKECDSPVGWIFLEYYDKEGNYRYFQTNAEPQVGDLYSVIFFEKHVDVEPIARLNPVSLDLTINHDSSISENVVVSADSTGSSLKNVKLECDESYGDLCDLFEVVGGAVLEIPASTGYEFSVSILSPQGIPPGEYSGRLILTSNEDTVKPVIKYLPLTINVAGTSEYNYTHLDRNIINVGANYNQIIDDFVFSSIGNIDSTINFNSNDLDLLSSSNIDVNVGESKSYSLNILTPNTLGLYDVNVSIGDFIEFYSLNVSRGLDLVSISPSNDINAGDNITIGFNILKLIGNSSSIIQSDNLYFDSLMVSIDGEPCVVNDNYTLRANTYDEFSCIAPELFEDNDSYNLTVVALVDDVYTSYQTTVSYEDIFAPVFVNLVRDETYGELLRYNFSVIDRNSIDSISIFFNGTEYDLESNINYSAVNFYNLSENDFSLVLNVSEQGDYPVVVKFSDSLGNTGNKTFWISYYNLKRLIPDSLTGYGSSIVSNSDGQSCTVLFKSPISGSVIYNTTTQVDGSGIDLEKIQQREYDMQIICSDYSLDLKRVNYNGGSLLHFEDADGTKLNSNAKAGKNFRREDLVNGTLRFNVSKEGSKNDAFFIRCSDWDSVNQNCDGDQTIISPTKVIVEDEQYIFELDVTGFSAYILVVPPVTDNVVVEESSSSNSGSSSGGGGSGGVSASELQEILEDKVGNLSKVGPTISEVGIDTQVIERNLAYGESSIENIELSNTANETKTVIISVTKELEEVVEILNNNLEIDSGKTKTFQLMMQARHGTPEGSYNGFVEIRYDGDFQTIPVQIRVSEHFGATPSLEGVLLTPKVNPEDSVRIQFNLDYPLSRPISSVLEYSIVDVKTNSIVYSDSKPFNMTESTNWVEEIRLENMFAKGSYNLRTEIKYMNSAGNKLSVLDVINFEITENLLFKEIMSVFGFPVLVWHVGIFSLLILLSFMLIKITKSELEKRKRYHLPVDFNKLPSSANGGYLGYIAETNQRAFMDFETLKVHSIVAGTTGGGKSFSSQVIVEEALDHNTAVVVFDPTAQWTGFLRRNTNEKLFEMYKKFGMKPKDAKGYKGNIRRIENPLEVIELNEYLKPGEITVFDLHKLTFEQIDLFVANTVSQVFMSELEETHELKLLMVYDEVHRLLPKFGGSGAGFMQIERACREFRKWGIGVLLISQVLSDFVGQIKANINTEIQMRTRDEDDLKRLGSKYGEDLLHSVVKAEVGTGMIQNSKYNKGRPYLVSFRPLKHAVERLSEKELQEYDRYNKIILDIKDSLDQLSKLKVDVMDLNIEVDLAFDKLKDAKFDVVEIYLEEISRKIDKIWTSKNKKPKKRKVKLLSKKEVDHFIELAKKQHYEGVDEDVKDDIKEVSVELKTAEEKLDDALEKEEEIMEEKLEDKKVEAKKEDALSDDKSDDSSSSGDNSKNKKKGGRYSNKLDALKSL